MVGPTVTNCADSQTCSAAGTCVNAFVNDTSTLLISETCYQINYPGDVTIAGYVGSEDDFAADGGDQCFPCPGDRALYGGLPQLDADTSMYVCNVAAAGTLSGDDNFQSPPAASDATVAEWRIQAHSAPFPTMGFPYPIQAGDGALTEILFVYNATAASDDTGLQSLFVRHSQQKHDLQVRQSHRHGQAGLGARQQQQSAGHHPSSAGHRQPSLQHAGTVQH